MSDQLENIEVFDLVARDFGLHLEEGREELSYQELVDLVADRVAQILSSQPETLFSLLYRLDVSETKVQSVMQGDYPKPTNVALAELIVDRQRKRLQTKKKFRQKDIDGWERW